MSVPQSIWDEWGFTANPFSPLPIPATEQGRSLVVGRSKEIDLLKQQIISEPKVAVLEGPVGVGKTSIINAAIYDIINTDWQERRFVVCESSMQVHQSMNALAFASKSWLSIAQAVINQQRSRGLFGRIAFRFSPLGRVDRWLNRPEIAAGGITAANLGLNLSVGFSETSAYRSFGFQSAMVSELKKLKDDRRLGGVICVLDDLELVQDPDDLTQLLETCRETLLEIEGLRWILCGAAGMLRTVARSPRLERLLHESIRVEPLEEDNIREVFDRRFRAYTKSPISHSYLPIDADSMKKLYGILSCSMANTIGKTDEYCMWTKNHDFVPESHDDKAGIFDRWAAETSQRLRALVDGKNLEERDCVVLEKLRDNKGEMHTEELRSKLSIDVSTEYNFIKVLSKLERVGLIRTYKSAKKSKAIFVQLCADGYMLINQSNKFQ